MALIQDSDVEKKAIKLHRQFGHTTAGKLKKLVRDANISDSKLDMAIDKVTNNCSV